MKTPSKQAFSPKIRLFRYLLIYFLHPFLRFFNYHPLDVCMGRSFQFKLCTRWPSNHDLCTLKLHSRFTHISLLHSGSHSNCTLIYTQIALSFTLKLHTLNQSLVALKNPHFCTQQHILFAFNNARIVGTQLDWRPHF